MRTYTSSDGVSRISRLVFAAAAVRRHAQDRTAAFAFPFTTRTVGAGSGATAIPDEADSRAEFWAPLWSRATRLEEMLLLMSEGRAVVDGGPAHDGLDFARAAGQLGIARGVHTFQRHGFLMRAGKAYFATPLGRVRVRENPRSYLVSELDGGGWLSRARNTVRGKNAPSSLRAVGGSLDEALFRLAGDDSAEAVQEALIAVGALMLEVGRRSKLRESLPPPPRLSEEWVRVANDGSHEFALAAALASLDGASEAFRLPFRRHLAPLDWPKGRESWSGTTEAQALVVWSGRSLIRDMGLVLKRRLIEARGIISSITTSNPNCLCTGGIPHHLPPSLHSLPDARTIAAPAPSPPVLPGRNPMRNDRPPSNARTPCPSLTRR